jgi:hypothetical protein
MPRKSKQASKLHMEVTKSKQKILYEATSSRISMASTVLFPVSSAIEKRVVLQSCNPERCIIRKNQKQQ